MKFKVGTRNESTRETWLKQALRQIPAGSRILDAGAGQLRHKKLCSHLDYLSQDFAQYDGRGDGSGLQTGSWDQSKIDIVSDIIDIPESDGSFDAVMCIEVLEHLPNPLLALQEFARLLRPGGHFIVTAPFCSLTHFRPIISVPASTAIFTKPICPALTLQSSTSRKTATSSSSWPRKCVAPLLSANDTQDLLLASGKKGQSTL